MIPQLDFVNWCPNHQPYILGDFESVKDREAELYVSGPLLARTYLNLPEKTLGDFQQVHMQDYMKVVIIVCMNW